MGEGEDSKRWISDALLMDTERRRIAVRGEGVGRYIEQLKGAGLAPDDSANYAALFMASIERELDLHEIAQAREIEGRRPDILAVNFGFFRGEHPATSGASTAKDK